VENEVVSRQPLASQRPPSVRHTWGRAKDRSRCRRLTCLVRSAELQLRRAAETKWQVGSTFAIGQEAEVPDAHEAIRKQVQQEATKEFMERESHQSLFIVMGGVTPAKGDFVVGERDQSVVGDSHAMSVTAQITEHILGASEGSFCIDHPIFSEQ
jgi:hypothetical protein